jgi:hypothetical protein
MGAAAKLAQVKISVDREIAAAFKGVCIASKVSMAAPLAQFMADYAKGVVKPKAAPDYSTRRRRRSAVKAVIEQLEEMKAWEEKVRGNMPENLQNSAACDAAEEAVSSLEEAVEALCAFWMVP